MFRTIELPPLFAILLWNHSAISPPCFKVRCSVVMYSQSGNRNIWLQSLLRWTCSKHLRCLINVLLENWTAGSVWTALYFHLIYTYWFICIINTFFDQFIISYTSHQKKCYSIFYKIISNNLLSKHKESQMAITRLFKYGWLSFVQLIIFYDWDVQPKKIISGLVMREYNMISKWIGPEGI